MGNFVNAAANTSTHKTVGSNIDDDIKNFVKSNCKDRFIDEGKKKLIVVMPGRFQPFTNGHKMAFNLLNTMFDKQDIFIIMREQVDYPESPLPFDERKKLIMKSGLNIKKRNIIPKNTLGVNPFGIAKDLGIRDKMDKYVFVIVLSEEDSDLAKTKSFETYYQAWPVGEFYNQDQNNLYRCLQYMPSMKNYGFRLIVNSYGSELMYDFKKEKKERTTLKKQALIQLGVFEIKQALANDDIESLKDVLPYDPNMLKDMEEYFFGDNRDSEKEKEKNKELTKEYVKFKEGDVEEEEEKNLTFP